MKQWFSIFLEKPLVSLVNLLMCILMVKFCLSTWLVLMCFGSGEPITGILIAPVQLAGLYFLKSSLVGLLYILWSCAKSIPLGKASSTASKYDFSPSVVSCT